MTYYKDNHATIYCLDFRKNELPDESVQCVVTSPPYWGLRKYSGEQELIWGGDKDCVHEWGQALSSSKGGKGQQKGLKGNIHIAETWDESQTLNQGNTCSLCGAWKGAYGLEPTPELYIQHTIEILREIRRVLRKDGVVFWNIGDSYWGGGRGQTSNLEADWIKKTMNTATIKQGMGLPTPREHDILKPKDLCLIPFRVAIAAQEAGWWVRSVIIWSKPNPMPESVTDRPTESHEYILMLTKSAKYYWDADAVREPHLEASIKRDKAGFNAAFKGRHTMPGENRPHSTDHEGFNNPGGRNIRTVWEFPTQPYPEAHFAVFPEKLPETCIKAATPEVGCCSKCGAPWERILSKGFTSHDGESKTAYTNEEGHNANQLAKLRQAARASGGEYQNTKETLGWQPTCKCNADKVPSTVLDPFAGAGTTLWVAKTLNRKAVGFDTSEEYCKLAAKRNKQQVLL